MLPSPRLQVNQMKTKQPSRNWKEEALAEYNRVVGPAWAEYNRVQGPALAEYDRVCAEIDKKNKEVK